MKEWISTLNIRFRLLFAFSSVILLSAILIFFSLNAIQKITGHKTTNEKLEILELDFTRQELSVKEFIYEGYKQSGFQEKMESDIINKFNASQLRSKQVLDYLKKNSEKDYEFEWDKLQGFVREIATGFDSLKWELKIRGFKDFGIEGSLRKAVHNVENSKATFSKEMLLTLRRNEKDFFLRKDLKYQQDFNKNISTFKSSLRESETEILGLIDLYGKQFNTIVDIEKEIGLTDDSGIRGRLKKSFDEGVPLLSKIKAEVMEQNQQEIVKSRITLIVIFVVQLILGLLLAIFYSDVITKSVRGIRDAMQALAKGAFPEKLEISSNEELGQTKAAVNHLVDRIETAVVFSQKLGNGELAANYDQRFEKDVLAQAIVQMQSKLKEADERQSKVNWSNEGIAKFNEATNFDSENLASLGDRILKLLVTYIGANQAALYVEENKDFQRVSTYAYGKKRFLDETISRGHGLIGQCALEGEMMVLTEVPNNYVKITSGLGEALPRFVAIVPLKIKSVVYGIVEIASIEKLADFKLAFIEKISESFAQLIASKKISDNTRKLLEESKSKAEILSQQEEEMRQNMEEMVALQEEMHRKSRESESRINAIDQYGIAIIEFDPKGFILHANNSFLNLMKYSLEEIEGKHHRIFVNPLYANSSHYQSFWEDLAMGNSSSGEFTRFTKLGKPVEIRGIYSVEKDAAGNVTKIVKIVMDITETVNLRKRLSQLEKLAVGKIELSLD